MPTQITRTAYSPHMGTRIPAGTTGTVWSESQGVGRWKARTRARLPSGRLAYVERTGKTQRAAEAALRRAVLERTRGEPSPRSETLRTVTDAWVGTMRTDARYAAGTQRVYALMARKHILGSPLADRRPCDITAGDIEDWLNEVARE